MAEVTESVVRQPEYVEKKAEQLLASVFGDPNPLYPPNALKLGPYSASCSDSPLPA